MSSISRMSLEAYSLKTRLSVFVLVVAMMVSITLFSSASVSAATCTPTGYNGLTAALVNPGVVSGVVDASGCDIGVYYNAGEGSVENAEVFGALWFGVVVNGDAANVSVDVVDSHIRNIGDTPFNGVQRGIGIYYRAFYGAGTATGRISGNLVEQYQKAGIVANGPGTNVQVRDNRVYGLGPVNFIAQNGIQAGYGASVSIMKNTVTGHSYTGGFWASGGIIVVGGPGYGTCPDGNPCLLTVGTQIIQNNLSGNDVGVFLSNYSSSVGAPSTATNIKVVNNTIGNTVLANPDYQAGISDVGNNDKLINNTITGYTAGVGNYTVKVDADPSFTNRPKVHANK
jgi:hypothetical protein